MVSFAALLKHATITGFCVVVDISYYHESEYRAELVAHTDRTQYNR